MERFEGTRLDLSDQALHSAELRTVAPNTKQSSDADRSTVWPLATLALDEIDYGILLVSHEYQAQYANQAARKELNEVHPLQLSGGRLRGLFPADTSSLRGAIDDAVVRGRRRMLVIGEGSRQICVSIVPLDLASLASRSALFILGRRCVCEPLSIDAFARENHLTSAETRILAALCEGAEPADIASRFGVAIATVRSQLGSLREKTGCPSIRALVLRVSALPPIRNALREACFLA